MSEFYKRFLVEDGRQFDPSGRWIGLAAFGKHPGWDDHVEDLGLESEGLITAKTLMYVNGIGGQIDAAAWEKLDATQQLPAFKHIFVWQRGAQTLIGRLWSSSDGKGRKRYPLVVCVHAIGVPIGWLVGQVLPRLAELEQELVLVKTAAEVRAILDRHRTALRSSLMGAPTSGGDGLKPEVLGPFANHAEMGASQEGLMRVLYQTQGQVAAFAPGKFNLKGDLSALRTQQVRVPAGGAGPMQSPLLWLRFFRRMIDINVPVLVTIPLEEKWVDVTLGEPATQEFYSLRALPKALPLVSEVPYNLDDAFRERARSFIAGFVSGATDGAMIEPIKPIAPGTVEAAAGSMTQRWIKWVVGGGTGLIVIGTIAFFMSGPDQLGPPGDAAPKQVAVVDKSADDGQAEQKRTADAAAMKVEADRKEQARVAEEKKAVEQKRLADAAATARVKADAAMSESARLAAEKLTAEKKAAEEKTATEMKRLADEKAQAEAAMKETARLMAEKMAAEKKAADEKTTAEMKRLADEKARAEMQAKELARQAEEKRVADLKAKADAAKKMEVASVSTAATAVAAAPVKPVAPSVPGSVRQMTNGLGMVLVEVTGGFWMGKFEVTQAEYAKVMGANPSASVAVNQPVENVSWNDAVEFGRKLTSSEKNGGTLPAGMTYTLPTQKQWSDCLGGARVEDAVTTITGKRTKPSPVGSGPANRLGLHDMLGNVWEICLDLNPGADDQPMTRGGGYESKDATELDTKAMGSRDSPRKIMGFRCVLVRQP